MDKGAVMKRPEKVEVGPFTWEINFSKQAVTSDLGKTDFLNRRITIYPNRDEMVLRETLMHEIFHICAEDIVDTINSMDADSAKKEETLTLFMNPRMFQTFRDNPDVSRYIFGI